jgi:tetratricopeptide (TPR) repeat protein
MADRIQLGIEMAKKAIEYDNAHKYAQAILCYDMTLEYFQQAVEAEQNAQLKATIAAKAKEYEERVNFLKKALGLTDAQQAPLGQLGATKESFLYRTTLVHHRLRLRYFQVQYHRYILWLLLYCL